MNALQAGMKFRRTSLGELLALRSTPDLCVSDELIESVNKLVYSHVRFLEKHIAPQSIYEAYEHVALLVEADAGVVGFCYGYYRADSRWMEVFAGFVEQSRRREGIGMAGFRELVKIGRDAGKSKFNVRFASENDERSGLHDAIATCARTLPVDVEVELIYRMKSTSVRGEQTTGALSFDAIPADLRHCEAGRKHDVSNAQQVTENAIVTDQQKNTYAGLGHRYQVYTGRGVNMPKFSARWHWLAKSYVTVFCGNADSCRMIDAKTGKTVLEWARATIRKTDN
jgi:hypothetical protein